MIYSAKIVQASGMTKQNTQFLFFIPERRLSYLKIVQIEDNTKQVHLFLLLRCSLSYRMTKQNTQFLFLNYNC